MALNIDLDGFGFLSESDASKLSPTLKQQPPVSPIESESSSGISSLDSDDLKKQLLSSPTISHDDDDQQSDGATGAADEKEEKDDSERDEEEDEEEEVGGEPEEEEKDVKEEPTEPKVAEEPKPEEEKQVVVVQPVKVFYQNRDILELSQNAFGSGQLVQFTVLPENNLNCFFQNRAQYWRLSSGERHEYSYEKCPCCDFTYPSTHEHLNQGPTANTKNVNPNAVTDSLLTFLKNSAEHMTVMPNNVNVKRMLNNGNGNFGNYQMPPQQPPQPPQQYQPPNNGFYNNGNYNQQMNSFMNNGNNYGTTLALLNLMNNASRNAASAFQAMNNTNANPRYYNNMNNGYGLYKQF